MKVIKIIEDKVPFSYLEEVLKSKVSFDSLRVSLA